MTLRGGLQRAPEEALLSETPPTPSPSAIAPPTFPAGTLKVRGCGKVTCFDAVARELVSGMTRAPTLQRLIGCLHPDDRASAWAVIRAARRRRSPFTVRTRAIGIDGLPRLVKLRAYPEPPHGRHEVSTWYITATEIDATDRPRPSATRRGGSGRALGILVAMVDLDHVRGISSSFGRPSAAEIITAVNRRLDRARFSAVLALDGDEFAVIQRGAASTQDIERVRRRLASVFDAPFLLPGDAMVSITASVGIAVQPDETAPTEQLMRAASAALDEAKQRGHGEVVVADPHIATRERRRLTLATELRDAVDRGDLRLFAQPQVDTATGRVVAYEALVRWRRVPDGLLLPDEFIPGAERDGTICAVGAWVLTEACRTASLWADPSLGIAVNVSPSQLSGDILGTVERALAASNLAPRRLTLELTESAVVAPGHARDNVQALRALGVRVSLDDFGAGMTSLSQLAEIACDELKLDRSFVARLDRPLTFSITAAVVQIGRDMGALTVCEGIETDDEYRAVKNLGADRCQGYLFGRPQPVEPLIRRLSTEAPVRTLRPGPA